MVFGARHTHTHSLKTARRSTRINEMDASARSESLSLSSSSKHDMSNTNGDSGVGSSRTQNGLVEQQQQQNPNDDVVLARRETKVVWCFKFVVGTVLLSSALGVAFTVYFYITGNEKSHFETKFKGDAVKVLDSIGGNIDRTLGIFDSLAVTLVSTASAMGEEWPFVSLPDFGVRMSKLLEWENYTTTHNKWINETIAVQESWTDYYGPIMVTYRAMKGKCACCCRRAPIFT